MPQADLPYKVEIVARTGLIAKGVVYCIIGVLAIMGAFQFTSTTRTEADTAGAFQFIQDQTGGKILLAMLAAGLLCYALWRGVQTIIGIDEKSKEKRGIVSRMRYLLSALIYLVLTYYAFQMLFSAGMEQSQNTGVTVVNRILHLPFGRWLVALLAFLVAAYGVYEIYFGFSRQYKKHVDSRSFRTGKTGLLMRSGQVGYTALGIVYLILAWLLFRAAQTDDASKAGDMAKALREIEQIPYGSFILGLIGFGLFCYGAFNFIWARYESFD